MAMIVLKIPQKKTIIWILVVIGLLNIIFWFAGPRLILFFQTRLLPFSSEWGAVYMANGDVYVGHIKGLARDVLKLSDAYFLNISKSQGTDTSSNNFNVTGAAGSSLSLIKWGFQQPMKSEGKLFINRSAMMFWEKLDSDSEVVKQLEANK